MRSRTRAAGATSSSTARSSRPRWSSRARCGTSAARPSTSATPAPVAGTSSTTPVRSAVLALDEEDQVLLVRQYRHPVRSMLWELPAGLSDVAGGAARGTARRELWEETGYGADHLELLLDPLLSPGSSSERLAIYLARGVRLAEGERHAAHGEELGMEVAWWPLAEVLDGVARRPAAQPVGGPRGPGSGRAPPSSAREAVARVTGVVRAGGLGRRGRTSPYT